VTRTIPALLALAAAFAAGWMLHTPSTPLHADHLLNAPAPKAITVHDPHGKVSHLSPTRYGPSHESSEYAPQSWRIVYVYEDDSVWFYEAAAMGQ
jgi:hypothetical protein